MPEYQFDVTVQVAVTITAEDEATAKETVEKEAEDQLFASGAVERNDTPMVSCELIAVDENEVE